MLQRWNDVVCLLAAETLLTLIKFFQMDQKMYKKKIPTGITFIINLFVMVTPIIHTFLITKKLMSLIKFSRRTQIMFFETLFWLVQDYKNIKFPC